MSQILRPIQPRAPRRLAALPAWLISIVAHASLLASLATVTWTVTTPKPDKQFTVGIMIKKDSDRGPIIESSKATFLGRKDDETDSVKFLAKVEPVYVADSLPKLPEADLSVIGLSGQTAGVASELLEFPQSDIPTGAMVETEFFGAHAWGSRFVYVIDRSGSMSRPRDRLGAAKRELMTSLALLPPATQFQIIFYNDRPKQLLESTSRKLQFATDENKLLAARELGTIMAMDGTEHLLALQMALKLQPDVVFLLTDADDLRDSDIEVITKWNRDFAKIHTIELGVGAAVDQPNALRELANRNGGSYRYIDAANLNLSAADH